MIISNESRTFAILLKHFKGTGKRLFEGVCFSIKNKAGTENNAIFTLRLEKWE